VNLPEVFIHRSKTFVIGRAVLFYIYLVLCIHVYFLIVQSIFSQKTFTAPFLLIVHVIIVYKTCLPQV